MGTVLITWPLYFISQARARRLQEQERLRLQKVRRAAAARKVRRQAERAAEGQAEGQMVGRSSDSGMSKTASISGDQEQVLRSMRKVLDALDTSVACNFLLVSW